MLSDETVFNYFIFCPTYIQSKSMLQNLCHETYCFCNTGCSFESTSELLIFLCIINSLLHLPIAWIRSHKMINFNSFSLLLISMRKWRENKIAINIARLIMQQTCFKWWLMLLALVHAHQQNINWSWSIKSVLINFVTFIIHPQNSSENMNIDRNQQSMTYDGIH